MSSWKNINSRDAAWYVDSNARSTKHCMPHGIEVPKVLPNEDNQASSFTIYSTGVVCNQ